MAQSPRDAVSLHSRTHRPTDYQTDPRTLWSRLISTHVNHDVGLNRPDPSPDCHVELSRSAHAVPRWEQESPPIQKGSSRERTAALLAPTGDDRPAGTGTHPQPESVHTCATPVVRLKCPLALGHGCFSSLRLTTTFDLRIVMHRRHGGLGRLCVSLVTVASTGTDTLMHFPARGRIADVRATVRGY
jgi:hypothetical protein